MRSSPEKQKIARLLEKHIQSILLLYSRNPKSLPNKKIKKLALIQDYSTQSIYYRNSLKLSKNKNQKTRRKQKKKKNTV